MAAARFDAAGFLDRADQRGEAGRRAVDQFGDGQHLHRGRAAELGFDQRMAGDLAAHAFGRHGGDDEQPEGVLVALHHPAQVTDHAGVEVLAAMRRTSSGIPQAFFRTALLMPLQRGYPEHLIVSEVDVRMARKGKAKLGPPYPSPPIFECVMELRFRDASHADFAEKAARKISDSYDHSHTEHLVNFEVLIVNGGVKTNGSKPTPVIKLTSNDQTDACTVLNDKVYWSRLAPYKGWDEFAGRIQRDLTAMKRVVGQRSLERVGLRYRNRIDVPVEQPTQICRYENYLRVKIDLPSLLDPSNGFEWRVKKEFPALGLTAYIMSGVMEPVLPMMGAFLLDIDISAQVDETVNRADIVGTLVKMRDLKNDIFERSITDVARESFC